MIGDCDKVPFIKVEQLQIKLFPLKEHQMGTFSDSNQDDGAKDGSKDESEGYTCHRLLPLSPSMDPTNLSPQQLSLFSMTASELYQVVQEACAQQNIKWPVECQVIPGFINHIEDWPLYPESFYQPTGHELRPQPVGDEMGRVVFQYYPTSAVNYFTRSCLGGNKSLSTDIRPPLLHPTDTTLQFESRFESGNLAKAVQISECYYELHLRSDLYTARHTQWFYFSVSNTRKDITYRFSIVNLSKGDSLYNHGMRPLMYSMKESELHNIGWRRCASNIVYFRNQDCSSEGGCFDSDDEGDEDAPSYTLTFNVSFPHDNDTVFLAHCFPYTYSMLQQYLLTLQNDAYRSSVCRQRILCRSLAGNPVYLLTISSQEQEDEPKRKRAVVLSARVHPGETPSSWIMKGILDFLTSDNPKAIELRRQFVFKIIPMVNPDGVIVGNHRCSLAGRDLNRQYKMVVKEMYPPVWHAKAMVRKLMDDHGVVMYCDFHAHSRKHNIFVYGCENRRSHENHLREQIFPLLLHYHAGDKFSFRNCKFRVLRCKEGTARVVVWMMGILHSYTLESSFGGASEGPRSGTHYSIYDLLTMGKQFCESLSEYFDAQPVKEKLRNRLWSRLVKKGSNADVPTTVDISDTNTSSDDSDRPPPPRVRRKRLSKVQKKKGLKMAEKPLRTSSVESPDDPEATNIVSVSDLLSNRLSLSDNEDDTSVSYWEIRNPNTTWDSLKLSSPNLSRVRHRRRDLTPTSGHRETLEPVIAKTRLHEPRLTPRSPRTSPARVQRVLTLNKGAIAFKKRDRGDSLSPLKPRLKVLQKTVMDNDLDCDSPKGKQKPSRATRSSSISLDNDELHKGERLKEFDVRKKKSLKSLTKISINNMRSLEEKDPLAESVVEKAEAFPQKLKEGIRRVSLSLTTKLTGQSEDKIRHSDVKNIKKRGSIGIDEDQLCADIASCDTLFLDIGQSETPQLKAARSLKGKVKKKKSSVKVIDSVNLATENHCPPMESCAETAAPEDKKEVASEVPEPEIKVKKKIKIVIGKRPKQKSNKKKAARELID